MRYSFVYTGSFFSVIKNKYVQFKILLPVCLTSWCMQIVFFHVDSSQEAKPEGITSLRITGVRRILVSLLIVIEIIMKLCWTCHDIKVLRPQLFKNSPKSPMSGGIKMSAACHGHFLVLQSSSRFWAVCVRSLEQAQKSSVCLVMFCVSVWWDEMYRLQ